MCLNGHRVDLRGTDSPYDHCECSFSFRETWITALGGEKKLNQEYASRHYTAMLHASGSKPTAGA